jgi:hypothetical protein
VLSGRARGEASQTPKYLPVQACTCTLRRHALTLEEPGEPIPNLSVHGLSIVTNSLRVAAVDDHRARLEAWWRCPPAASLGRDAH